MKLTKVIALDVGEKRIGVAAAESATKLAYPVTTILVDGSEYVSLQNLIVEEQADTIVVGYPRNQQGEPTMQTKSVELFVEKLHLMGISSVYQDESLTSVAAEKYLQSRRKNYTKADVDAYAATIILTDYMETHYA
ncbi:MAG TPA: Holliday junction resolvase RuvX [Candidatus Nitrosotenuis sp.]|nr:Holliday junction resolvase RuvX [Candidatus Nitrosotenuis sp.]